MRYSLLFILLLAVTSAQAQIKQNNFAGVNNDVLDIIRYQNTVFAGGAFDSAGAVYRNHLAAVDAITGAVLSWNPNPNGEVRRFLVTGNKLVVAGLFDTISGVERKHIAVYDLPSLNLLTSNINNTSYYEEALYAEGGYVYYNAYFPTSGDGIARFGINTLATDLWRIDSLNANSITAITILNNYVYVAGAFTYLNAQNIARFDKTTRNLDTSFHFYTNGGNYLEDMISFAGKIYVCGNFSQLGGLNRNGIAEIDPAGFITSKDFYCSNHVVSAIFPQGNTLWIGSNSANIGGNYRYRIGQVDINSGYATCWDATNLGTGNASRMTAIYVQNDTVYAGAYANFSNVYNSITAFVGNPSYINIGPDLTICPPVPFTLNAAVTGFQSYAWNNGSTASSITSSMPGLYWVTATSSGGCSATDSVMVNFCTSINDFIPPDQMIMQNVVQDYLYLNATAKTLRAFDEIMIYDLAGHTLLKLNNDVEKVNTERLNPAIYFVCFKNRNAVVGRAKFIKL